MGKHRLYKIELTHDELDRIINALGVAGFDGHENDWIDEDTKLFEKLKSERAYPNDCIEYRFQVGDKVRLKYAGDPKTVYEVTSISNWFCLGFPMYWISCKEEGTTKVSEDSLIEAWRNLFPSVFPIKARV